MGQDKRKAMEYFRSAARQDLRFAQAMIGVLYAEGYEGRRSSVVAFAAIECANERDANGVREQLLAVLKPQELEAARQLSLNMCQANNFIQASSFF